MKIENWDKFKLRETNGVDKPTAQPWEYSGGNYTKLYNLRQEFPSDWGEEEIAAFAAEIWPEATMLKVGLEEVGEIQVYNTPKERYEFLCGIIYFMIPLTSPAEGVDTAQLYNCYLLSDKY